MSDTVRVPLNFRIGARTVGSVSRRLVKHALSLDEAIAGRAPAIETTRDGDGYVLLSVPEVALPALSAQSGGLLVQVRQRYRRYYTDLTGGYDAWWNGLSSNTRSGLKRKAKKLGVVDVRRYATPAEVEEFHALARGVSATTYQEKLLDYGLPDDRVFRSEMLAEAAAGGVRAWLLFVDGEAVAYLYCPVRGRVAIYEYVGHDPRFGDLSPGTVLHVEALRDLFADAAVDRFDFTEGESQHKRALATGDVACADVLLLKPTIANRAALAGLEAFDAAVAGVKGAVIRLGLAGLAKRLRQG